MEVQRMRYLMKLWSRFQSNSFVLMGHNSQIFMLVGSFIFLFNHLINTHSLSLQVAGCIICSSYACCGMFIIFSKCKYHHNKQTFFKDKLLYNNKKFQGYALAYPTYIPHRPTLVSMIVACMATNWVHHGLRTKCHDLVLTILLAIKLLHAYCSKHRVKAFLLMLFVVSIPLLRSKVRRDFRVHDQGDDRKANSIELEMFQLLIRNLTNEGILGLNDKGLIIYNDVKNERLANMDMITYSDLEIKDTSLEPVYDFVFTHEGKVELTDKVLKVEGIMLIQKKGTPSTLESFQKPLNYEIVGQKHYELRLNVTIIALTKTRMVGDDKNDNTIPHRRLMFERKKAEAIKNLENVLLEPPRAASGKSKTYSKKTRYLPDLMEDSLEDFPRLVFIDVNGDVGWFAKNYPTRNKNFEIYQIETTITEIDDVDDEPNNTLMEAEITDWLRENVKKGEYVVMKAEADVVEELINNKSIELVDELFMECKYQSTKCKKCKRPYWKCLALYGQLKDLGVAVHQWWG